MSDHLSEFSAQSATALAAGDYAAASEFTRKGTPVHGLMGLEILRVDPDAAVLTMEVSDNVRGAAPGTVHGGILGTFADAASAIALSGSYDTSSDVTVTTDIHIRYYRQPRAGGRLTATATVVHAGRRLLGTECCIVDSEDRVLARSTATYMLVPRTF